MNEPIDIIIQVACCNTGEARFCTLCPWKETEKCENESVSADDLFEAISQTVETNKKGLS